MTEMISRLWMWLKSWFPTKHVAPDPTGGPKIGGAAETKFVPYQKNDREGH